MAIKKYCLVRPPNWYCISLCAFTYLAKRESLASVGTNNCPRKHNEMKKIVKKKFMFHYFQAKYYQIYLGHMIKFHNALVLVLIWSKQIKHPILLSWTLIIHTILCWNLSTRSKWTTHSVKSIIKTRGFVVLKLVKINLRSSKTKVKTTNPFFKFIQNGTFEKILFLLLSFVSLYWKEIAKK